MVVNLPSIVVRSSKQFGRQDLGEFGRDDIVCTASGRWKHLIFHDEALR